MKVHKLSTFTGYQIKQVFATNSYKDAKKRDILITFFINPVLLRLAFYLNEVSIHRTACVLYNCK